MDEAAPEPTEAHLSEREEAMMRLEGKLGVIDEVASDSSI